VFLFFKIRELFINFFLFKELPLLRKKPAKRLLFQLATVCLTYSLFFAILSLFFPSNVLLSVAQVQEFDNTNQEEGFSRYQITEYGIRILYPSSWRIEVPGQTGDQYYADFYSPDNLSVVTLIVEPAAQGSTIETYRDSIIASNSEVLANFNLVNPPTNAEVPLAGNPAYRLDYTHTEPDFGELRSVEIGTIIDDKAYALILKTTPEQYDNDPSMEATLRTMVNSFNISITQDFPSQPIPQPQPSQPIPQPQPSQPIPQPQPSQPIPQPQPSQPPNTEPEQDEGPNTGDSNFLPFSLPAVTSSESIADMFPLIVVAAIVVIGGIALGKYSKNRNRGRRIRIPPSAVVDIHTKGALKEVRENNGSIK
jgi:photosystem II reaction center protein PsbP